MHCVTLTFSEGKFGWLYIPYINRFLMLYGTPCNIQKDESILKYVHNQGFKNFEIYDICPQNAFIKFHKKGL